MTQDQPAICNQKLEWIGIKQKRYILHTYIYLITYKKCNALKYHINKVLLGQWRISSWVVYRKERYRHQSTFGQKQILLDRVEKERTISRIWGLSLVGKWQKVNLYHLVGRFWWTKWKWKLRLQGQLSRGWSKTVWLGRLWVQQKFLEKGHTCFVWNTAPKIRWVFITTFYLSGNLPSRIGSLVFRHGH